MVESSNTITAGDLKVASMVQSGKDQAEAVDRGNGIYGNQGIDNSYLITTSDGNVLVNAGALKDARRGKALFARVSGQPIRHIVLAAEPDSPSGRETKKEALARLLEQTGGNNLWERMWITAAIRDTES